MAGEKEAFLEWVYGRKKVYNKELCIIRSNINKEKEKLNILLEKAKKAEDKEKIQKKIDDNNIELEKIKYGNNNVNGNVVIPQSESIEVTRNTKGYNFSVKILSTDVDKIKKLTDELNKLYPRD